MNFPFPMFITTWHMLFATVLTQILSRTTDMLPGVKEVATSDSLHKYTSTTKYFYFCSSAKSRCRSDAQANIPCVNLLRNKFGAEQQGIHLFISIVYTGNEYQYNI